MEKANNILKTYGIIGKILLTIAGGIVGFIVGNPIFTIPGIVIGFLAGHLIEKGAARFLKTSEQ